MSTLSDILSGLTQGQPVNATGTAGSLSGQPDWYQQLMQGMAARGVDLTNRDFPVYQDPRIAGFNQDQNTAFQQVRDLQGGYQPVLSQAQGLAGQIMPMAQAGTQGALGYASGAVNTANQPTQNWTQNWQQYMSPYTQGVVNEIGRQGRQNFADTAGSTVMDPFIGSGQFGSTRNADVLGQQQRLMEQNILGQQAAAMQQGYQSGMGAFQSDAARQAQQQALAASTGLGAAGVANTGAQIGANAAATGAGALGQVGQLGQQLGLTGAGALGSIGGAQQQLQQQANDVGYQNFQNQVGWDWNNLNNLNSIVRGMQLPTQQTQITNQPVSPGTSPLAWINSIFGMGNANAAAKPAGG